MRAIYSKTILLILLIFFVSSEVEAKKSHKILHMPPNKIADFVVGSAGDKRIIMMYTSWCPICRKIMPKVMDIENLKPGTVIAISQDDDYPKFIQYLDQYNKVPFMIFLNKPVSTITLQSMFQEKLGAKPWEGYPHFILLDGENTIVSEGNFEAEQLADFIFTKEEE